MQPTPALFINRRLPVYSHIQAVILRNICHKTGKDKTVPSVPSFPVLLLQRLALLPLIQWDKAQRRITHMPSLKI